MYIEHVGVNESLFQRIYRKEITVIFLRDFGMVLPHDGWEKWTVNYLIFHIKQRFVDWK